MNNNFVWKYRIFANAVDAELAMKSCYMSFGIEYWQFDYFFLGDAGADVAYAGGDGDDFFQIDEYRINSKRPHQQNQF